MRRLLAFLLIAAGLAVATPRKPKLILAIVVDQLRYDYLTRYRSDFHAGFDRLLTHGAVFTNAQYIHFPTVTAVGHSTVLTGATPSVSGIIGNEWYDQQEKRRVQSITDTSTSILGGGGGAGASPRRLLVTTVGDELKAANGSKSRVIGISLKDRSAILTAGHLGNGAYWFQATSGEFVSSTYYFKELPAWVQDFNQSRPAAKFAGIEWSGHKLPTDLKQLLGNNSDSPIEDSPYGNDLVALFAERALVAEQLGKRDVADILAVSFSSNDKVGHDFGPYSAESRAVTVRTDTLLDQLISAAEKQVGPDNLLVVLTADHGVAPSADEAASMHLPGGRMSGSLISNAVLAALNKQFGPGNWILGSLDLALYFNRDLIAEKKLDPAEVERVAARAALGVPHIARVYTRGQLLSGAVAADDIGRRMMNSYNQQRGADLMYITDPFWTVGTSVSNHGTPYLYDSQVPLIFMGSLIRPGRYDFTVTVNDIAPTLAAILEIAKPAGAYGRTLTEVLLPVVQQAGSTAGRGARSAAHQDPRR